MLEDDLPEGYIPLRTPNNYVFAEFAKCEKIAVNGIDVGPGSLFVLTVAIKAPQGEPVGNHLARWYLLDFRTDNEVISTWFATNVRKVSRGTVSTTFSPLPPPLPWGDSIAKVMDNGTAIYSARSTPYGELISGQALSRTFFGPNPQTDFWQQRKEYRESRSDGEGFLSTSSDSKLSRAMDGVTEWTGLGAIEETEFRAILPRSGLA